jgi:hypothetical protein
MKTINTILSFLSLVFSVLALSLVIVNPILGPTGSQGETGEDGTDGQTPYIGENGNWWIGDQDTGVVANAELEPDSPFDDLSFGFADQAIMIESLAEWLTNEALDELEQTSYVTSLSEEGYAVIDSAAELMSLSNQNGNYVLGSDIDLSNLVNWSPIDFGVDGFSGTLDGAGFTISGLDVEDLDTTYSASGFLGLFNILNGATIRHLTIDNFNLSWADASIGALAGEVAYSSFAFIQLKNSNLEGGLNVGGLIGRSYLSIFDNIETEDLDVTGQGNVGGFVGDATKTYFLQSLTLLTQTIRVHGSNGGAFAGKLDQGLALMSTSYGVVTFSGTEVIGNFGLGGMFGLVQSSHLIQLGSYTQVISLPTTLTTRIEFVGGIAGLAVDVKAVDLYAQGYVQIRVNTNIHSYPVVSVGGIFGEQQRTLIYRTISFSTVEVIEDSVGEEKIPYNGSEYVAGLVGYQRASGKIIASANVGTVIGGSEIGGIVGGTGFAPSTAWSTLVLEQTANFGLIKGSDALGGLVGAVEGAYNLEILESLNSGSIIGDSAIGGLVGFMNTYMGLPSSIKDSYNAGLVEGSYAVGGLVGATIPNFIDPALGSGSLNIEQSFNAGVIDALALGLNGSNYRINGVGGIMGFRYMGGTFTMTSYLYVEGLVDFYTGDGVNQVVYATEMMVLPSVGEGMAFDAYPIRSTDYFQANQFLYEDLWDFTNVWEFNDDNDYPQLKQNIAAEIIF